MAKLQKLVTVTTYRWEEADLTEEQAALFKDDEYAFMENYSDGEYDLDFDLTGDKVLEDESDFELLED
tara:strand:+ start:1388 stop:1591 length:204 start_codon:yes stop_codon:yes gene_type:complete